MANVYDAKDRDMKELEKRISDFYKTAVNEMQIQFDRYVNGWDEVVDSGKVVHHLGMFERREQEQKAFDKGVYTKEEFNRWWASQEGRRDYWLNVRNQMAERMTNANVIASAYINDQIPHIFTMHNNFTAQLAEKCAMERGVLGIRFDLVDEYTIKRLMNGKDIDSILPYTDTRKAYDRGASYEDWWQRKEQNEKSRFKMLFVEVEIPKDEQWNREKLQNALTQGIISGDTPYKMGQRFQAVTNMNRTSAIRNARTAMTRAFNAGAQDRYDDLEKQGVETTKVWSDVYDHVPPERQAHWDAHHQEVPSSEPFVVGGEELMFPGDTSLGASGWNVYNCRCHQGAGSFTFKSMLTEEQRRRANVRVTIDMVNDIDVD